MQAVGFAKRFAKMTACAILHKLLCIFLKFALRKRFLFL